MGPDGVPVQDLTLYRSLAGGSSYPTLLHRIGTLELGLQLYASATTSLVGYTDADWAGCPSTRRSTSGYCVFLGDNLLSWSAKRQHTISRSSAEAEYRGVANVVAETAWIRNLLRELHSPLLTATLVYCDNVSAVYMSANPVQHQRTKHIEIDIHFVRDMVKASHVREGLQNSATISLMFQQHHGESLSEAWTRFKELLQKVPHHGIDLWLKVQIFYDHVNPVTRRTIDQPAGGKLHDRNAELLEDLTLYDNESWNDPRDFAKLVKAISLPQDVPSTSDRRLIELENQCMEDPEQAFVEYASSRTDEAGGKWYTFKPEQNNLGDTYNPSWKSHPNLRESYKPRPSSDGVGAQIPYYARKDFLDCHFPKEWESARDAEINPFKDVLVFRRMG
ncbi:ribonuclease H-like domain-containing protein [Tanacetum coccineum]